LVTGIAIAGRSKSNTAQTAAGAAPVTVSAVSPPPTTVVQAITAAAGIPAKAPRSVAPAAPVGGTTLTEGTYVVGADITAGEYKTNGGGDVAELGCYWARMSSLNTSDIIDNGFAKRPTTIEVQASDKALQTSGGCTWTKLR
jgi:hypothetical protein